MLIFDSWNHGSTIEDQQWRLRKDKTANHNDNGDPQPRSGVLCRSNSLHSGWETVKTSNKWVPDSFKTRALPRIYKQTPRMTIFTKLIFKIIKLIQIN